MICWSVRKCVGSLLRMVLACNDLVISLGVLVDDLVIWRRVCGCKKLVGPLGFPKKKYSFLTVRSGVLVDDPWEQQPWRLSVGSVC